MLLSTHPLMRLVAISGSPTSRTYLDLKRLRTMNNMYHMLGRPSAFVLLNPCLHCSWSFLATPVYPSVSIMSFWAWQVSIGCGHNCQSWGSQSTSQQTNQKLNGSKPQALSASLWWLSVFVFFLVLRFPENVSLCCIEKHMEAALVLKWFVFSQQHLQSPSQNPGPAWSKNTAWKGPWSLWQTCQQFHFRFKRSPTERIIHWKNPRGSHSTHSNEISHSFFTQMLKKTFYSCQIPKPMASTAFNTSQNFGIFFDLSGCSSLSWHPMASPWETLHAKPGKNWSTVANPHLSRCDIHGISRNISTDQSIVRPMRDLQHLVKDRLQIAPRASEKMQFPKQGNGQSKCSMQAASFFPCLSVSTYDSIPWESCHMTSNVNQAFKRRLKLIEGA